MSRRTSGKAAEDAAARHLRKCGYKILERNYSSPLGEIDIVALDGDVVCFVEVRSRSSGEHGSALEALGGKKQRKVTRAAAAYMKAKRLEEVQVRFDFAAVDVGGEDVKVKVIKNAFWPGELKRGR